MIYASKLVRLIQLIVHEYISDLLVQLIKKKKKKSDLLGHCFLDGPLYVGTVLLFNKLVK